MICFDKIDFLFYKAHYLIKSLESRYFFMLYIIKCICCRIIYARYLLTNILVYVSTELFVVYQNVRMGNGFFGPRQSQLPNFAIFCQKWLFFSYFCRSKKAISHAHILVNFFYEKRYMSLKWWFAKHTLGSSVVPFERGSEFQRKVNLKKEAGRNGTS